MKIISARAGAVLSTVGVVLVIGILLGVLVGMFFVVNSATQKKNLVNPKTLCPVDEPIMVWGFYKLEPQKIISNVAVVIDATDRIPTQQAREIGAWFNEIILSFQGKKITVYELRSNIEFSRALFEKCAPSLQETFIEKPQEVQRKFKEDFYDVFMRRIGNLTNAQEKDYSPILETIERMFETHDEIILISDLLQHHSKYSLYHDAKTGFGNHDYQDFLNSPYANRIKKNHKGKKLTVLFVPRQKLTKRQTPELIEFWKRHMEKTGGEFVLNRRLTPISK